MHEVVYVREISGFEPGAVAEDPLRDGEGRGRSGGGWIVCRWDADWRHLEQGSVLSGRYLILFRRFAAGNYWLGQGEGLFVEAYKKFQVIVLLVRTWHSMTCT